VAESDLLGAGIDAAAGAATSAAQGAGGGVGATIGGAVAGAAIGTTVATVAPIAVMAGTAIATAAAASAGGASAALTAFGVGTALGNAIPIPGVGAAIGAVVGAAVALGTWIASVTTDSFHPTPDQAEALLAFGDAWPPFYFLNVDKAVTPDTAARLVRYLLLVAGKIPKGKLGNTGELYNPVSNTSCDNPYMCIADPDYPFTDEEQIAVYYWEYIAAQRAGKVLSAANMTPVVSTPTQAAALLALLRKYGTQVSSWSEVTGNQQQIAAEVKALRLLAGEDGSDAVLNAIVGADVSIQQPTTVDTVATIVTDFLGNGPGQSGGGPWLAGAAVLGLGVVASAVAVTRRRASASDRTARPRALVTTRSR
jgi:hypothetical protein